MEIIPYYLYSELNLQPPDYFSKKFFKLKAYIRNAMYPD